MKYKVNKKGCSPKEDVCMEHCSPLACKHGCEEALPHKCKEKESPDYEPLPTFNE